METKPAVPVETKPKIPTFRQWVETETGLVHSLVDILDRELEAFWFAYLEQFFGNSRQQKLAGIKEWGQYRSNPTSPRWVYPLQHLDGFSKTLISSNARNAVVRNTPLVRIYHVNGGVVSFLTFIEFLSKEGQDIESIAELKPNHLASLWMLYVSFLEEKNPGYRDLFQQFFDPPRCSLVQSFLNKCTNACLQIKFILGIYEDGYAKIRQIQWDHRLPEDECIPICKPLSVDESPKTKGDVHCEGFLVFVLPRLQQATKPIHYAKQTAKKTAGQKNHAEMKWLNQHQNDILSQCKKNLPNLADQLSSVAVEGDLNTAKSTKLKKKKTSPDIIVRLEMFVSFECCQPCQEDFAAVISKQLSTWCDANSTDEVLLHAVVKIWCYAPYLDQDDTLPDRFYEAKEGVCYRVYRAPRHLYLMQRHADAAAEGKKT